MFTTSVVPIQVMKVPDYVIKLQYRGAHCNLRLEQRVGVPVSTERRGHGILVHEPVREFLKTLPAGRTVAIFFQGYSDRTCTVVTRLDHIYWTNDDVPRLDFVHPKLMSTVYRLPNFWATFILAIIPVSSDMKPDVEIGGEFFCNLTRSLRRVCLVSPA